MAAKIVYIEFYPENRRGRDHFGDIRADTRVVV
jgi:hypothetical protein